MKFKLSGIKNSAHIHKIIKASTSQDAHAKAKLLGITPTAITPIESTKSINSSGVFGKSFFSYFGSYERELLLSFRQISFMLDSAISIDEVLKQCAQSTSCPKIKSMYQNILKSLLEGVSLSAAFARFGFGDFDLRVGMIELGESTGSLAEIFDLLAQQMQERQKELSEFKKKLFYPCMVFVCTILAFGFLNARVLPEFVKLFEEMSIELPFATKALIMSGEVFSRWGILALIGFLAIFVFVRRFSRKSAFFMCKIHQHLLNIPIFGKILLYRDLYRYFLGFYFCQKAGLKIKQSLSNSHASVANTFLKAKLHQVGESIEKGENLSNSFAKSEILDFMALGLIVAGERSGNLEKTLQISSAYYKDLYTQKLDSFSRYLEPMMSVFVGLLVLWFALGILTPMWNLNNAIF